MSSYYGAHLIYHPQMKTFFILKIRSTLNNQSQTTCVNRHNPRQSRSVFLLLSHLEAPSQSTLPPAMNLASSPAPSLANLSHYIRLFLHILKAVKFSPASRFFAQADVFACNTYPSFSYPQKSLRTFPLFLLECRLTREAFMEISAKSTCYVPILLSSFMFFPILFISI